MRLDMTKEEAQQDIEFTKATFSVNQTQSHPLALSVALITDPIEVCLTAEYELSTKGVELGVTCGNPDHLLSAGPQLVLNGRAREYLQSMAEPEAAMPVLNLALHLQAYLNESGFIRAPELQEPEAEEIKAVKIPNLKRVLIWSHHLKALSKRKDIIKWSDELQLWGISKPGYPGLVVLEGLEENANEFVARIKRLQWQALQIRCEEVEEVDTEQQTHAAVMEKARLRRLDEKIGIMEVGSMGEAASIMNAAGLGGMFKSALKL